MSEAGFHALLAQHLDAGTRPGLARGTVGITWTAPAFGRAVGFDERTIRNWRSGSTVPDDESLQFILDALFGDEPGLRDARAALEAAWDAAYRRKLAATPQLKAGLAGLTALRGLDLRGTPTTNVDRLTKLESVEALFLGRTRVADISPLAVARSGRHSGHRPVRARWRHPTAEG